jgi:hypothetical protein
MPGQVLTLQNEHRGHIVAQRKVPIPAVSILREAMENKPHRKSSARASWAPLAAFILAVLVLMPAPALAYLDPGTGSFIIQGVIAAVVGVGLAIKMFWHRIKAFFTGQTVAEDDDEDE